MSRREYKKKLSRTIRYSEIINSQGKYIGGGILNPTPHIESEMWVEIMDDPVMDRETDETGSTGRPQIHLAGTQKSFEELGTLFLALAYFSPPESGYSVSVELNNREGKPGIHFVLHQPIYEINEKPVLPQVHTVATGFIDGDGNVIDTTLPIKDD